MSMEQLEAIMGGPDTVVASLPQPRDEFISYPKIPRLRTCSMVITEKIDGTNGQLLIPEDPAAPMLVGSRNRWLTPDTKQTDNFGFAAWVAANAEMLRRLGPGRHYGEWWGVGIGRGYGLAERRWSLFDAQRWTSRLPEGLPSNVGVVPLLSVRQLWSDTGVPNGAIQDAIDYLRNVGSVAMPGYKNPEGIVVKLGWQGNLYKFTLDGDALNAKKTPSPIENPEPDAPPG